MVDFWEPTHQLQLRWKPELIKLFVGHIFAFAATRGPCKKFWTYQVVIINKQAPSPKVIFVPII